MAGLGVSSPGGCVQELSPVRGMRVLRPSSTRHDPEMTSELLTTQDYSRADLIGAGFTSWTIDRELAAGRLIRVRRDHYVRAAHPDLDRAVRIGGRLSCVTLLALWGVFVFDPSVLHVQVGRAASRLRSAVDGRRRWMRADGAREGVLVHWADLHSAAPHRHAVAVFDAIRCAIRCQSPWHAVATLDSAVHLGLVSMHELREAFATLPARFGAILALVDGRCEAGTESLVRLMLRQIGAEVALQVELDGVGRVDFVVDGWLIIECDSKAHHEGWAKQQRDRRRDIAAARLGYTTIRPLAEDVLYRPAEVRAALRDILARHR